MWHVVSRSVILALFLFAQLASAAATTDLAYPPGYHRVSTGTAKGTASAGSRACSSKECAGRPFYKKVWFWALVGVTVVAAATVAIVVRPTAVSTRGVEPIPIPVSKTAIRF